MTIYEKLLSVQAVLKAPKSQYNAFGKYNYRNCEDIIEAAKPHLKSVGLLLVMHDDIEHIGDRFYVKATATVIDIADGTSFSVSANAREENEKKGMDGSQVTGASSSYARKYALNGLFAIDDTKDSDTTNTGDGKEAKMESVDDAKNYALTFGKYKGKTLGELFRLDRKYLEWLYDNEQTDAVIRKGIEILLAAVRNKVNSNV